MSNSCFDPSRKFVRVLSADRLGMVEFEFAVGDPDLFVELVMPPAAFNEFCAANQVTLLERGGDERGGLQWSLHEATQRRFGPQ